MHLLWWVRVRRLLMHLLLVHLLVHVLLLLSPLL